MGALIDRDEEHLRLLKVTYYVLAGISGLFSLFPLLWVGLAGILMSGAIPAPSNSNGNPARMGLVFLSFGIAATILGLTLTLLTFLVARNLRDRRHRTFCMVIAGLCCLYVPCCTAIGVCAFIVLNRSTVKMLFDATAPSQSIDHSSQAERPS